MKFIFEKSIIEKTTWCRFEIHIHLKSILIQYGYDKLNKLEQI